MDAEAARPVPAIDAFTQEFWTGGERGELRITRCVECARLFHPPEPICPFCACRSITHATVSGRGHIDSFTVVRRPWLPGYEVPYIVARVRLADQEDVVLVTNIVDAEPSEISIGAPVEAVFEKREDVYVPMFTVSR